MMKLALAACVALLALTASPVHASFTQDDRYFDSRMPAAQQKVKMRKAVRHKIAKQRYVRKMPRAAPRITIPEHKQSSQVVGWGRTTIAAPRETIHYMPIPDAALAVVHSPRPRAWCGWWLGRQLGLLSRSLWLARNWAHVGSPAGKHVGAIVVWRHHVGKITAVRADGAIKVLSGNDGRAVRDRWRSARGVIAYRAL